VSPFQEQVGRAERFLSQSCSRTAARGWLHPPVSPRLAIARIAIPRVREQRSSPSLLDGDRHSPGKHLAILATFSLRLPEAHWSLSQQSQPTRRRSRAGVPRMLAPAHYEDEQASAIPRPDPKAARHDVGGSRAPRSRITSRIRLACVYYLCNDATDGVFHASMTAYWTLAFVCTDQACSRES